MKHKPHLFSRIAAIVLALAMVLTALPQSVFAMDSSEIDSAIPLTLDEPVAFHSDDGKLLLSFTPEETRDYVFYMTDSDNCEPYAELYDADLMLITSENLYTEKITCELTAGAAYYFEVTNLLDTAEFSASVCLTMPPRVSFDANGGYFGSDTDATLLHYSADQNGYLTQGIPEDLSHSDSHKQFAGWSESPDAETALDNYYETVQNKQYTEDTTYYAVYDDIFIVTYDANGGYFLEDKLDEETQEWVQTEVSTYTRTYYDGINFDVSVRPQNHDSSKQFMGWQDADGTVYDWNSQVTQDLTVYAQWADTTTITFHANGGYFIEWGYDPEAGQEIENQVDSASDTYLKTEILFAWNTPPAHHEDPAKVFAGWATSENATTPDVIYEETAAGDLTDLWAVWTESIPVTYHINHDEIRFIGDENEHVTEMTMYYPAGSSIYTGNGAPFDYYKPEGSLWHMRGTSENPDDVDPDYHEIILTKPLDLYCIWYEGIEITFDANGGYFWDNPNNTSVNSVYSLGSTAYEIQTHYRDDLTPPDSSMALAGWSWTADGSNPVTGDLEITRDLNGKTLYAIWSGGIPVTFHINHADAWFNVDGKPATTITKTYAAGATLRSHDRPFSYSVEEDSFLCLDGISENPDAAESEYWEKVITEPLDLYCVWYLGVDIYVNANGGYFWGGTQDTSFANTFRIGDTINLMNYWGGNWISHPDPDKALVGFSWSADGKNPFTEFTPSEDDQYKTLYAVWADGIKVTFHVNSDVARFIDENGNRVETIQRSFAPGTVIRSHNEFFQYDTGGDSFLQYAGFFPEQTASQTYTREYTITEPTEFYCSWYRGINFRFDANGGYFSGPDGTTVPVILEIGQSYNLLTYWSRDLIAPDSTKTLVGWSWDPDGNEPITDCAGFIPTEAMNGKTIYAVWGDGITVTYHSMNENVWFLDAQGNHVNSISITFSPGSVIEPYSTNYFRYGGTGNLHWLLDACYSDADLKNRVYNTIEITEDTSPFDLYCTWIQGVSITMNGNGGLFWGTQEEVDYIYRLGQTVNFDLNTFNITPPASTPDLILSGWSWEKDGTSIGALTMTEDLDGKTLYAIWDTGIHVTLHTNLEGAYFIDNSGNHVSDLELALKKGTQLQDILSRYNAVPPAGSNWSDTYGRSSTPDGPALPYDTVLTDGMDLYVIWAKSVPLILDAGDGTYGGQQVYQTSIRAGSYFSPDWYTAKPNQEGMAFLGWSLTNSKDDILHGRVYASDFEDGITLHAIYAPGHELTVRTNNPDYGKLGVFENGESYDFDNIPDETTFLMAQGKELNYLAVDYIRSEGYIFLGWSKTIDGEILDWDYVPDQDSVLYGIFAKGYEIYFIANGGTFDETLEKTINNWLVEVPEGSPIGEVSVWHPSKTFVEWNTKPDGSGETIDPATYVPTKYMDLYAIWADDSSYVPVTEISFDTAGFNLVVGESISYPATVFPENATNKKVTYTSSNDSIAAVDANGKVTAKKAGEAIITATSADSGKKAAVVVQVLFKDVTVEGAYYYTPVYWAAFHDPVITAGYSDGTFGVGKDCQRRELLIFMWRYAGCPTKDKAGKSYGDARKMFNDMNAYGATTASNQAVAWAYKEGIVKGYSDGGIHPTASIVRKDVMIMLYRLAGKPAVSGTLRFSDCKSFKTTSDTYKAILWGSKKGITKGYSDGPYKGQFGVNLNCLREQIVTFLYRYETKL